MHLAGAGAGVYNTSRQIGAVLGSAAIAVLMDARLSANLPKGVTFDPAKATPGADLPAFLRDPFSTAMGQALIVAPAVLLIGLAAALLLARPKAAAPGAAPVMVAD
jgi:hypothetical protein